ncbi:MAG: sugar phosphate isomerase/epimerase family protein, partial [Faecousia sp.]
MNLSFSTRGWQEKSWEENLSTALTMHFGGIELYNVHKARELTDRGGPLHKYNTAATVRTLHEKGLKIPCLDTSWDVSAEDGTAELQTVMEIAHDIQCPYVSITAQFENEALVRENLTRLQKTAAALGVCVLIKTSGIYADTARLRALLDTFACDELGALWDIHHTYRDFGESGDTTIKNLGAYVRHVHLRDSDDDKSYNLIGEGTLPVAAMMR